MISFKIRSTKFLLVVLFCVFVSGDAEVRCIETEREALLSFKNGLIDKDGILSSWQSNECCRWNGVECSNTTRHVVTLKLNRVGYVGRLQGEVRSSLLDLHHLNHLDLSGNDFGGIPIPEFIGAINRLQDLYLSRSNFSGSIPPQLGNLTNLHSLYLSYNDFGGIPIPEFIGSMKQLQHLSLSGSNFSGTLPPRLGNLTNLRSLDLSRNSLRSDNLDWFSSLSLLSSLDLSFNSLRSENLDWLSSLSLLTYLDLSFIHLNHTNWSHRIQSLRSLSVLRLQYCNIGGSIPDLQAFSSLTELSLQGNSFTGSIPLSIGQLSNLEALDLSSNSLEGLVSESHFIKLHKLYALLLDSNRLTWNTTSDWNPPFQLSNMYLGGLNVGPYFPKWIQTQRNLDTLELSNANITGEVPRWLWNISSLRFLYLYDNQLSGTIPNLSSTSLTYMDISNNQFSGSIPILHPNAIRIYLSGNMFSGSISSICKTHYDQLDSLNLSDNELEGEVPNCWEKMPNLYSLNLANNKFSGEIPGSLGALHSLAALQMHGNNLSGELPYNLGLCQRLIFVDVGDNKLTGKIPTWIGHLYNMQFLNLRGNRLHGSIPPQICNLTDIQVLDLSINNLSSTIPDCFNNFIVLANKKTAPSSEVLFFANSNENKLNGYSTFLWKGQESKYWDNLEFLKLIDFSSNGLTGGIPQSFSDMRGLKSLNLSKNSLTGYIITDIGKLNMLDSLDLSHNQLSGKIPTSLADIYSLGVLDLSNNNLSGKIPTSTQLQSFNASSYARNEGLCGDPLPKCPEDILKPSPSNPVENMKEKDNSNLSFMAEVGISMAFGFIFGFMGVVCSFILKKSWRIAFFNLLDAVGDWFYTLKD